MLALFALAALADSDLSSAVWRARIQARQAAVHAFVLEAEAQVCDRGLPVQVERCRTAVRASLVEQATEIVACVEGARPHALRARPDQAGAMIVEDARYRLRDSAIVCAP